MDERIIYLMSWKGLSKAEESQVQDKDTEFQANWRIGSDSSVTHWEIVKSKNVGRLKKKKKEKEKKRQA